MKNLTIIMLGIGATVGIILALPRQNPPAARSEGVAETGPVAETNNPRPQPAEMETAHRDVPVQRGVAVEGSSAGAASTSNPLSSGKGSNVAFAQLLETLVSAQSDHAQRKAAWKKLRKSGKLDDAIIELEQRAANDPRSSQNLSALGQAYYKKAGQIEDIREQAILAMKADQTLEAALNLDPSDWEARFTKIAGMSYWPTQLNKGPEVIAGFEQLIRHQESQSSELRSAEPYLLLGNYYQTLGQPEQAAQIWQRGAAQFPADEDLKAKLAK